MASEEDNFDIDIYGDGGEDYGQDVTQEEVKADEKPDDAPESIETIPSPASEPPPNDQIEEIGVKQEVQIEQSDVAQKIASTDQSAPDPVHLPKQAPQAQGLKRKEGADDRFVEPGATSALFVSDLHWWINDDDVRGWANQSQCEDELEDITFSEHKVNGKSKGQAYVLFKSPQAATASKQKIESLGDGQHSSKRFTISYTNPYTNPFKTLPKDGPMRNNNAANSNRGGYAGAGSGGQHQSTGYNNNGGYRGNRGGGYNRGGMNNMSGFNRGGFQQPMTGGFQGSGMGFQAPVMGGLQPYGGFQSRGGMTGGMRAGTMGMRGGRGGMSNGMMGMPMGAMGMGALGMNMPQMGGAMAMQGNQAHFNPAFFPQGQQAGGDGSWNPHGAKRTRQE